MTGYTPIETDWIAVDWGTSNMRAWLIDDAGQTIQTLNSNLGMGRLKPDEFESTLLDLIGAYLTDDRVTRIICCGMVGSRQGWAEAAYTSCPCRLPVDLEPVSVTVDDPRIEVLILPGVKQVDRPDVMRGEETQIAGFLSDNQNFCGVICLPGTHTKWVRVVDGEMLQFHSFMTGELFSLLTEQSILRHSISTDGWSDSGFYSGLTKALSDPTSIVSQYFGIRARSLISDACPKGSRAYLSGLLIGQELASIESFVIDKIVVIVGDDGLASLYKLGLERMGAIAMTTDTAGITLRGLSAVNDKLESSVS